MGHLKHATLSSSDPRGVWLDCGDGVRCRIEVRSPWVIRVLFVQGGTLRQPTTWMVLGEAEKDGSQRAGVQSVGVGVASSEDGSGGVHSHQLEHQAGTESVNQQEQGEFAVADVPWSGRPRLQLTTIQGPPLYKMEESPGVITLRTTAITLTVALSPLCLSWSLRDGKAADAPFAADRASHPYFFGRKSNHVKHYMERKRGDFYCGLGDKTGPLNLHGRRLRCDMTDALGYDPKSGDPLYKNWPYLLLKDATTGVSYGVFYDNTASSSFDLGCEHSNYYGLYRGYEATDGDLDYYFILGPRLADVTRRFADLTGKMAFGPRWSLGYAATAMPLADAPDAQVQIGRFLDECTANRIPCSAFHFGSGYTSIGPRRYVFNWNRDKFPDPKALIQRFKAAGLRVVANLKPCLLNDHPRYAEAESAGAFVRNADTGRPSTSQFWDGEGAHLDFLTAAAVKWWQTGLREAILEYGIDSAWNDNNEYELWDEEAECGGAGLRAEGLGGAQGSSQGLAQDLAQELQQGSAASGPGTGAGSLRAMNGEERSDGLASDHETPQLAKSSIDSEAATSASVAKEEVGPVETGHVAAGNSIPIALARPVLALLMTRASYEEQVRFKPEERPYTITRAGCPGVQRYGQTWSGDNTTSWDHLRWNLRTGLQMSLSGMFNVGHDVGGFAGDPPDPELLVRWVQMGALHPRCVTNSWKADGTVTTPWMHPAVTAHARSALRLRYRLMPYTYTLYWRAAVENEPILQPTFVEFEDDERTFDDCDEMMLGGAILAAPVVERGATTRKVYLPRVGPKSNGPESGDGTPASSSSLGWYDFYGEEWFAGGQAVTLDAPLEKLPLLVAEGSLVPMTAEADDFGRLHDEPSRCVRVFPFRGVGKTTGQLYEDDGLGWGFRNGGYRLLTFEMETNEEVVRVTVASEGSYKLPYDEIVFAMPANEKRPLKLSAGDENGLRLVAGRFQWHE